VVSNSWQKAGWVEVDKNAGRKMIRVALVLLIKPVFIAKPLD
jgi:hypothetical protein